ncbi:MAG: hypothetical protein GX049_10185 [Alcaligenaceae bacterium]|nr:hypothetical protein [Alcaligenaceae bacterium]
MKQRIDCALIAPRHRIKEFKSVLGAHASGRLNVHWVATDLFEDHPDSVKELASKALLLRRFDVCLLPASSSTLGHLRTSLKVAEHALSTPVVILSDDLKAPALNDLHGMHIADFIRVPVCFEELRARLQRVLAPGGYPLMNTESGTDFCVSDVPASRSSVYSSAVLAEPGFESRVLDYSEGQLHAIAVGKAVTCATDRHSFKAAKAQVTAGFERAYINAVLARSSGNIAMAARYAKKHRRAFWALMCKHGISPDTYRSPSFPDDDTEGKMEG